MSFLTPSGIDSLKKFEVLLEEENFQKIIDIIDNLVEDSPEISIHKNIIKSLALQGLGKYDESLNIGLKANFLAKEIDDKLLILKSHTIFATNEWKMGKINSSFDTLQKLTPLLEYKIDRKELIFYKARINMIFANINWSKGYYLQASEYTKAAIINWKLIDNDKYLGFSYNNLGYINLYRGNFEEAINSYIKSYDMICRYDGSVSIAHISFNIVYAYLQLSQMKNAQVFVKKIKKIKKMYPNNQVVKGFYDLSSALTYKYKRRMRYKIKAENLLRSLRKRKILEFQYHRLILIHLTEHYLDELMIYGGIEIIEDIQSLIDELKELNSVDNPKHFEAEVYLIQAKFYEVQGNIDEAERYARKGLEICDDHDFHIIYTALQKQLDEIHEKRGIIDTIGKLGDEIDNHAIGKMQNLISDIIKFKFQSDTSTNTIPVLFQIIHHSGISIYSMELQDNMDLKEELVSNFLTAINDFSQEAFSNSGSMEMIRMQDYSILIRKEGSVLFAYIFKGRSLEANIVFNSLITKIKVNFDLEDIEIYHIPEGIIRKIDEIVRKKIKEKDRII